MEQPDLEGRYANYFEVGYNAFEFVINFGQLYEPTAEGRAHTRIITSPVYAKALVETLADSIKRYESSFGVVAEPSEG